MCMHCVISVCLLDDVYGLLLDVVYSVAFLYRIIQLLVMGCVCQS